MNHGTITGYATLRCRCTECKQAGRNYNAERRGNPIVDENRLSDLLHELFPDGLTDECPVRQRALTL